MSINNFYQQKRISYPGFMPRVYRFLIYGVLLSFGETFFYTVIRLGKALPFPLKYFFLFDWRTDPRLHLNNIWEAAPIALFGQVSLWMIPAYGIICVFGVEPAIDLLAKRTNFIFRGLAYSFTICAMEIILGPVFHFLSGYKIWYYEDAYSIATYTSLAIAPIWFFVGIISEHAVKALAQLQSIIHAHRQ